MERVMCIDATTVGKDGTPPDELKYGDIYTKIGEHIGKSGKLLFHLEETWYRYGGYRFIPLSEIDETELLGQRQNQLQTT